MYIYTCNIWFRSVKDEDTKVGDSEDYEDEQMDNQGEKGFGKKSYNLLVG